MLKDYKINTLLLMVLLSGLVITDTKITFIICLLYFGILLIKKNFLLGIPRIPGFKIYCVFIIYATLLGLLSGYEFRNIIRDLFYLLPTVFWILSINEVQLNEKYSFKFSILKTIYLYAAIASANSWIQFLLHGSFNFSSMRNIFGLNVYDVGMIAPIFLMEIVVKKEIIFSKLIDKILATMMVLQIVLSFGRVAILAPLLETLTIILVLMFFGKSKSKYYKYFATFLAFLIVSIVLFFIFFPPEITMIFMDKVQESFTEINSHQVISGVGEAMNNWRGYEIQAISKQWRTDGLFYQIFGRGLGSAVKLEYVPYSWVGILFNDELPIAHNGFYTLLSKGGIFAVTSLLIIYVASMLKSIKSIKYNTNNEIYVAAQAGISVAAIALTYVVRGPVQQEAFLGWAILIVILSGLCHSPTRE